MLTQANRQRIAEARSDGFQPGGLTTRTLRRPAPGPRDLPAADNDAEGDRFRSLVAELTGALTAEAALTAGVESTAELSSTATGARRVNEVIAQLADAGSPRELIDRAPESLCRAGRFDRAMISRVNDSVWRPQGLHVAAGTGDPVNVRLAGAVLGLSIPLTGSLIETTVLRRRASIIVDGTAARVHSYTPLGGLSSSHAYVVAPIVVVDRVVGFLHADCRATRRALDDSDRVLIATFADLFGLLYEKAVALGRLLEQRSAVAEALSAATGEPADVAVPHLAREDKVRSSKSTPVSSASGPDLTACGGLTEREWEILGLLATGATNTQIAATLVVSESTVKSHVKRILHKLPASNRAEAVYRYTRLAREESTYQDAV